MDFFRSILESLPLEGLSDILGEIVIWWSQMVSGVSPDNLPIYAYLGGSIVVLLLWLLIARIMPRPLGGMTWMVLFAILLAPGTALGDPSTIAPASISVVYALMMKDTTGAIANALPVLIVLVVGLFIGFVWQLIRGAFETSLDKARQSSAEDVQATMQLTTGDYLAKNKPVGSKAVAVEAKLLQAKEMLPFAMLKKSAAKRKAARTSASTNIPITNIAPKESAIEIVDTPKIDQTLKRKPVEGFYSNKLTKEQAIKKSSVKDATITSNTTVEPAPNNDDIKPNKN